MKKIREKVMLIMAIALAAVMLLSACAPAAPATPATPTAPAADASSDGEEDLIPAIVGFWGGTCEAPIFVAYENGFFRDAGLDVQMLRITQDVSVLMVNNELDSFMLTPAVFKAMQQGLELIIIDTLHIGCIQGVATPESGILTPADLEGRTVGVEQIGGIGQIQASSQMVLSGADPSTVDWRVFPNPQLELAMERGEIEAFIAFDPWAEIAMQNGMVRFFSNTHDEGLKEFFCCFLGMSSRSLEANPEMGRRLSQAFARACAYIEENPDEVAEMMIDRGYVAGDVELNAQLLRDYTWLAGNYEMLRSSFFEIWRQIYRAGALGSTPDDLEAYIQAMYETMVVFKG